VYITDQKFSEYVPTVTTQKQIDDKIKTASFNRTPAQSIQQDNNGVEYHANAQDFMDPSKNTIVKSFESSGGRGLPGFIESLGFEWFGSQRWGPAINDAEVTGKRAPMMCKVSISFSPFHDITPGLDHLGYNRAAIYKVGHFAPQKK
jgi:hypothetical protein